MKPTLLGLLALCAFGCRGTPPAPVETKSAPDSFVELTQQGVEAAEIRSQRVTPGSFVPRLRLAGSITGDPRHIAQVGARVAGRVTAVRVVLGDTVKTGQILIDIDSAELHETTLAYLTALAKARAAKDALARQKQLVDERVGALADLRRLEGEAAAADAAVAEGKEHLQFLGLSSDDAARIRAGGADLATKTRVRSPIDGRVASLTVSLGQAVSGSETLAVIADVNRLTATMRVYERDLADVHTGSSVDVQVPTYAARSFPGSVTFIGEVLDPASHSAELRVDLSNDDGALRPGMSASAFIARARPPAGMWLPAEAVQTHDGKPTIFIRAAPTRFLARDVEVGAEEGGFVPVLRGLSADDDVVVHGALTLRAELERNALEE